MTAMVRPRKMSMDTTRAAADEADAGVAVEPSCGAHGFAALHRRRMKSESSMASSSAPDGSFEYSQNMTPPSLCLKHKAALGGDRFRILVRDEDLLLGIVEKRDGGLVIPVAHVALVQQCPDAMTE